MNTKLLKSFPYIINMFFCIFACTHQTHQVANPTIKEHHKIEQQSSNMYHYNPDYALTEKSPKPSWIDNPPQNERFLYGIGIAPKQKPVSNQIQAAKILAMRDITQQITVYIDSQYQEIQREVESKKFTNIESHTKITSESLLKRVKRIDSWNDVKNCDIYTLVSVKLLGK